MRLLNILDFFLEGGGMEDKLGTNVNQYFKGGNHRSGSLLHANRESVDNSITNRPLPP